MHKKFCLLLASLLMLSVSAMAEEGATTHYIPGTFSSFMDALPTEPGFAVVNYFLFYQGDASANRSFPLGGQIALDVDATSYAYVIGGFYVTPLEILGGHYSVGVALPFVHNTTSAQVSTGGGATVRRSDTASGLGDMQFWPIAMSWGFFEGDLRVTAYGGIFAPTGGYEVGRLANQGLNYWTFSPGVLISYLGQKNGFEASAYIGYDINTKNQATDYLSGQVFHIDFTIAQHLPLGPGFIGVGASGFYLQQTTGDSGSGALLGDFAQTQVGIGPTISYVAQFSGIDLAASVTWLPQLYTRNTVTGDYIWVKVAVSF